MAVKSLTGQIVHQQMWHKAASGNIMQKAVLITGCSSGIGLAAANHLLSRGYYVLAACRKPADVARMNQLGFDGIQLDLDDPESVDSASDTVLERCNHRLYGLFNNAGFAIYGKLDAISRVQMERQFSTNLFGTHQLTMKLLPAMQLQDEGRIINTSSVLGLVVTAGRGTYAASKFALEAWSDALRQELYGSGIHVSLIEPGPIDSRFTENVWQAQAAEPVKNPGSISHLTRPVSAVLPALQHALESKYPRRRYPVTPIAWAVSLLRLMPAVLKDRVLCKK